MARETVKLTKKPDALVVASGMLWELGYSQNAQDLLRSVIANHPEGIQHPTLAAELLNRCEAFVFPSRYEGTPKALLEAMACGVPVIAARSPGITEVVTHDQTGYLCGISALEIRAAISTVLKDPALRDRLGRDGARYVKDHHALMTAVDQELTIVTRLCPAVEAYG